MMLQELFTVYDSAARRYLAPFYAPTIEFALRQFRQTVNTPDHQFNSYPEDYALFHIGTFNQETGKIEAMEPHSLGLAITFVDPQGPELLGKEGTHDA